MPRSEFIQYLIDSGVIYFVLGALLCIVIGVGAIRRMFRDASRFEHGDRDPQRLRCTNSLRKTPRGSTRSQSARNSGSRG